MQQHSHYATGAYHVAALSLCNSSNAALSIMQWQHIMQQNSQCNSIKPLRVFDFAFASNICLITPSVTLSHNLASAYMYPA